METFPLTRRNSADPLPQDTNRTNAWAGVWASCGRRFGERFEKLRELIWGLGETLQDVRERMVTSGFGSRSTSSHNLAHRPPWP